MSKRGAFIFDLDGTLCDCLPRVKKYLEDGGGDYEAFYAHCEEDDEHYDVCQLCYDLGKIGWDILFVTGRKESCREATLKWIAEHISKEVAKSEHLFMRQPDDYHRDDYVTKCRNYRQHIEPKWHVVGVFEDRDQCVRAWRDLGLTCYQVADGCY